jgi:photosystem II stability/assembly factor-like uncharacterized protein
MRKLLSAVALCLIFMAVIRWQKESVGGQVSDISAFLTSARTEESAKDEDKENNFPKKRDQRPSDWFYMQRAYPYDTISNEKYMAAIAVAHKMNQQLALRKSSISVPVWTQAGPTNIPGRITDIAVNPSDHASIFAAGAAGGLFKSTDSGKTWTSIFDDGGNLSVGAVAIDPVDPNIMFLGTGEANPAYDTYEGTGVYKSTNGGVTWSYAGLPNSYRIGRIIVDPNTHTRVFVAVGGKHFGGGNPDRGVYRSEDGGNTWQNVLYVSDTTGCIDLALSGNYVFAAMWERVRYVDQPTRLSGMTSGIYRSANNGNSWVSLAGGLPAPADTIGRIGLSIDPISNTLYAIYSDGIGNFIGLYKSTDMGDTWTRTNDAPLVDNQVFGSWAGGWYFGQVRTVPGNPNIVFVLGLDVWKSLDGGASWFWSSYPMHADHHAMWIDPSNPNFAYAGCDGGVYCSLDGGNFWTLRDNQPSTQFYAISIDPTNPARLYGGAQDNGTMRTLTGNLNDWDHIYGGDGFYVIVDPTNPDIIYAESQYGYLGKSLDGGLSWYYGMLNGMDYGGERHDWSTPIIMDPSDPQTLYYGSNFLYKTTDGANNWNVISPDLTDGPHPRGGFGTISTIAVSPSNPQVIYVGTDDGNVWVTQNGGTNWTQIDAGLPGRWITRVAVDSRHANIAYVTLSGYLSGSSMPHVFRSTNYGLASSWINISNLLPDAAVNDIIPDPVDSLRLYIGTDYGVYYTTDLGTSWTPLGTGMPIIPVHDLAYHPGARKLVAGTHGRSMFATTLELCGDANSDGLVNIRDITFLISYLYKSGPPPNPLDKADVDANTLVNIRDITYLINYLYKGGPAPNCL